MNLRQKNSKRTKKMVRLKLVVRKISKNGRIFPSFCQSKNVRLKHFREKNFKIFINMIDRAPKSSQKCHHICLSTFTSSSHLSDVLRSPKVTCQNFYHKFSIKKFEFSKNSRLENFVQINLFADKSKYKNDL